MAASRSGSGRSRRPGKGLEKPEKGICSNCRSDDLYFYDDGRGECLECGHRFWWDKGPKARIPASQVDRRRRPSRGRRIDDGDGEDDHDRRGRPGRDRDSRSGDDDDREYAPPGRRPSRRERDRMDRNGDEDEGPGDDDLDDDRHRDRSRRPPSSMDWEEDFDTDDDEFGDEEDGEAGEEGEKKGKRFEIKIGQPTVTGVEKDGGDVAVVEPLPDSVTVTGEIPKEFRDRLRALEKQMSEVNDRLDGLRTTLDALDSRLTAIDNTLDKQGALIDEMEGVRQDFLKVEATVNELSAIYDLVSAQINPFIDMGGYPRAGDGEFVGSEVDWDLEEEAEEAPASKVKNPFVDEDMAPSGGEGKDAMPPLMDEPDPKGEDDAGSRPGAKERPHPLDLKKLQRLGPQKWLLRWTDFLLTKVEPRDLPLLLNYYKELGWIDEKMEDSVMAYLDGVKGVEKSKRGVVSDEPDILVGEGGFAVPDMDSWKLTMEDHTRSLEFLEFIRNESPGQAPRPAEAAAAGQTTR